jgi:glycosyltransferase involved in cell wall biosynthesis
MRAPEIHAEGEMKPSYDSENSLIGRPSPAGEQQPLASILTPSLNQKRFLVDCIDSVANQTHRPIEHVICDGGSTDGTHELLRRAPAHVHWTSEPDRGQAHAVNKALERSRGSVVGWLNSDDAYADRRTVARVVDVFERRPDVDVVFGHALLVNEDNLVLQLIWTPAVARPLLRLAHYVYQPTVFFRREALESQPLFLREDLDFVFDRELLLRLVESARFYRLDRVLAVDRHQRERKVENPGYVAEAARFDASIGLSPTRRRTIPSSGLRFALRLAGASRLGRLPEEIDPPIDLRWPSRGQRLLLQLTTRRRRMPFASY